MERKVLWIGYVNQLSPLRIEIALEHDREVDEVEEAKGGLEATATKQYPLILVNDVIPITGLILPEQIPREDIVQIGCHVIRKIRCEGQNMETPLMVTHIGQFPEYSPEKALKMYKKAGATECFNWAGNSLSDFATAVGKYL